MRTGIKIFIALIFIVSSLLIGRFVCIKSCNTEKKEFIIEIQLLKAQNKLLSDSIVALISSKPDTIINYKKEKQGITKNIVHLADSAKNENGSKK